MDTFWRVVQPDTWPAPPDRLSYSSALDIETCARRWALHNADYTSSLGVNRYPSRPRKATLLGQLAHQSLRAIADELQAQGCSGLEDPRVVTALRKLGGISAVLDQQVRQLLASLTDNPRAEPIKDRLQFAIERSRPTLRQLIQGVLQRIFGISYVIEGETSRASQITGRQPVTSGFHTEVKLAPKSLPWAGWADAVKVSEDSCEIVDYKSGVVDPSHAEQVRIYALLWARDTEINPDHRLATHLTIVYPENVRSIPPPDEEGLDQLETQLQDRSISIARALEAKPPPASVSRDNCRYCDLKHLCEDYWTHDAQMLIKDDPSQFRSMQVHVRHPLGSRSWAAVVEMDQYLDPGTEVVIISSAPMRLRDKVALRLIDVRVDEETDAAPTVHVFNTSEVFRVSSSLQT